MSGNKNTLDRVAVASRSFSKNEHLRSVLLSRYEHVIFNDAGKSMEGDELVAFLSDHTKAITGLERLTDDVLARLPNLRVIGKYGVGTDMLDLKAMERRGINLGWTPGVNRLAVAELTLGFMLALIRLVPSAHHLVKLGGWSQIIGRQLSGKTVGVIGCGFVGQELVRLLSPFQCRIIVFDKISYHDFYRQHACQAASLEFLLQEADIVTLHLPLDQFTAGTLDLRRLKSMKRGSFVINAARGGLVEESAVCKLLADGHLAGAAFDVFEREPPEVQAFIEHSNVILTPHIGGSAVEAIHSMGLAAIEGLDIFGKPSEVVRARPILS